MKRSRARAPESIEFARLERATANEFARTLWQLVRSRQICNQKFRREYPIPPYTVDFCCVELKVVVEVDGSDHITAEGQQRDRVRDEFLNRLGYQVLRLRGFDVLSDPLACQKLIAEHVKKRFRELEPTHSLAPSPPAPLPQSTGGEG